MKRLKKPTRSQKMVLSYYHLKPENWLVKEESDTMLVVVHRYTDEVRGLNIEDIDFRTDIKGRKR